MIIIKGRIFIKLQIDGRDVPFSPGLVHKITMTEGGGALSPAIELVLFDYAGALNKELALTDGNEITITVGKDIEDIKGVSRQYRVFGVRQVTTGYGPGMQVIGIYDAPGYLTGSVREAYKGNTGDVLKKVADKCKLCYSGPEEANGQNPDDSQVWRNVCKSRAMFVQEITRHAYVDQQSTMVAMLTSLGQLKYRNLNDVVETPIDKIKRVFLHNTDTELIKEKNLQPIYVSEARPRSTAGLMNTWQNYGSTRVENTLAGKNEIHDKVDVKTSSEYLPINAKVKKTVDRARIEYTPLDCGNTHKNYQKAQYQNIRTMALFTEHVSILTGDVTDLELLDPVLYRQANADPKEPLTISDIYIVVAKTIFVKNGSSYAERFEIVRRSLPTKGATELSCSPSPSQSAASTVPDSQINPTVNTSQSTLPAVRNYANVAAPVEQQFSTMKGTLPTLTNAVKFALPPMQMLTTTLAGMAMGMNRDSLKRMLGAQIVGAIPSMLHYINASQQMSQQMQGCASQLQGMCSHVIDPRNGMNPGVRQALMSRPGGIMDSYTASLSGMRNQMNMTQVLGPIVHQLPEYRSDISQYPGGGDAYDRFIDLNAQAHDNLNVCTAASVDIWNSSLSTYTGKPVPQRITTGNPQYMMNVVNNQYQQPRSGSYLSTPLQQVTRALTSAMLAKSNDRIPRWIPRGSINMAVDTSVNTMAQKVQRMEWEAEQAKRREDQMYDAAWSTPMA
jgi:hypothetical protein